MDKLHIDREPRTPVARSRLAIRRRKPSVALAADDLHALHMYFVALRAALCDGRHQHVSLQIRSIESLLRRNGVRP